MKYFCGVFSVFLAFLLPLEAQAKIRMLKVLRSPYKVSVESVARKAVMPVKGSRLFPAVTPNMRYIGSGNPSGTYVVPSAEIVKISLMPHGYGAADKIARRYDTHLKAFLELKKDLETMALYQNLEPRSMERFETNYYVSLVNQARKHLGEMERVLGARDPAVHYGKVWLAEVEKIIDPNMAKFVVGVSDKFLTEDLTLGRELDRNEFLLKNPDGSSFVFKNWDGEATGQAFALAEQLPARSIAVLNDDPEILEWIQTAADRGWLGKGTRVRMFTSMDALANLLKDGVRYDMILLDYVLEDGVSLYVVDQVRALGDKQTVLLINSAFMEDEVHAEELFSHGVDGFVSSVGFWRDNVGPRLATALHNYGLYKAKHNWAR